MRRESSSSSPSAVARAFASRPGAISSRTRMRSTTRPSRFDSTPSSVPTAVSRNTGATASEIRCEMSGCWENTAADRSDHRLAQAVLQMVNMVERDLQLLAVLRGKRVVPLLLPLADLRLHRGLVDALHLVVNVHVDVERLADRLEQVVLVHLRRALHRFVLDAGRDLAQLGNGLLLQLGIGVRRVC